MSKVFLEKKKTSMLRTRERNAGGEYGCGKDFLGYRKLTVGKPK